MKKICISCGKQKNHEAYSFKNKSKNLRSNVCKSCHREYTKRHYEKNKALYLNRARTSNKEYIERNREFIWNYLITHPCVDCGEPDPLVLEFDHIRDKQYNVSRMVNNSISIETIKNEIAKCKVRCANCHRRKTAKTLGWWRDKK